MTRLPAGDGNELVHSLTSDTCVLLPTKVADLLYSCQSLRTLDDHIRQWHEQKAPLLNTARYERKSNTHWELLGRLKRMLLHINSQLVIQKSLDSFGYEEAIEQLLRLTQMGFLVSEENIFVNNKSSVEQSQSTNQIGTIGVVTKNRSKLLARCIVSYAENVQKYSRNPSFVVADDSDSEHIGDNLGELSRLKATYGIDISYVGLKEKRQFAELLTKHHIPREIIDFALFGSIPGISGVGANRNSLMLATIDKMYFSVDDDTLCRVAPIPEKTDRLKFYSGLNSYQFWFFPDQASALNSFRPSDENILSLHEQILGKTLNDVVSSSRERVDIESIRPQDITKLQDNKGKIITTYTSCLGDSGLDFPNVFLSLDGNSRERLMGSEEAYRTGWRSRQIWRGVNSLLITDDVSGCMGANVGYDNRALLPPFMPIGRSEDAIFGLILRVIDNSAYFGHLPWSVLHLPEKNRYYPSEIIEVLASSIRLCDIFAACIQACRPHFSSGNCEANIKALGANLVQLSSLQQRDFESFLRARLWKLKCIKINLFEDLIKKYNRTPSFWVSDIRKYMGNLHNSFTQKEYIIPIDIPKQYFTQNTTRDLLMKFGKLLQWWPEIVKTTRLLFQEDHQLARCV